LAGLGSNNRALEWSIRSRMVISLEDGQVNKKTPKPAGLGVL